MFRRLYEWVGMKRRGEHRISPHARRGRIYARTNEIQGNIVSAHAKSTAVMQLKITRKDGTVDHVTVPATVVKEQ